MLLQLGDAPFVSRCFKDMHAVGALFLDGHEVSQALIMRLNLG